MNKILLLTALMIFLIPFSFAAHCTVNCTNVSNFVHIQNDSQLTATIESTNIDAFLLVLIGILLLFVGQYLQNATFFIAAGIWFIGIATAAVFVDVNYIGAVFYLLLGILSIYHGVGFIIDNTNKFTQNIQRGK